MELRRRKKDESEYLSLKMTLIGLGFYEDDMNITEMRQILQALQLSEGQDDKDSQETEFIFENDGNILNSTMKNSASHHHRSSSSSPEPHFEILTVKALVHHPLDWSPPRDNQKDSDDDEADEKENSSLTRKRNTNDASPISVKRLRVDFIENAPDSGLSLSTSSNSNPISERNWNVSPFDTDPELGYELSNITVEHILDFDPSTSSIVVSDENDEFQMEIL